MEIVRDGKIAINN